MPNEFHSSKKVLYLYDKLIKDENYTSTNY